MRAQDCWTSTRNRFVLPSNLYLAVDHGILSLQQSYEEMFMKINPLDAVNAKNKSKDIHLPNIDVNFGSNRILSVLYQTLHPQTAY